MSRIALGSPGYVYVMVSASLSMAGLIKIGASTNDPLLRAAQLTASTSAPTRFVVAYSRWVNDVNEGERAMHELFADRRVNEGREYFQCSVYEACVALDRVAGGASQLAFEVETPMALLFNSFPDDGSDRSLTEDEARQCRELEAATAAEGLHGS